MSWAGMDEGKDKCLDYILYRGEKWFGSFFFGSVNRQIDNKKKCAQIDVVCHRYYGNGPRETVTERSNLMGCMSEYMDRYYAK